MCQPVLEYPGVIPSIQPLANVDSWRGQGPTGGKKRNVQVGEFFRGVGVSPKGWNDTRPSGVLAKIHGRRGAAGFPGYLADAPAPWAEVAPVSRARCAAALRSQQRTTNPQIPTGMKIVKTISRIP